MPRLLKNAGYTVLYVGARFIAPYYRWQLTLKGAMNRAPTAFFNLEVSEGSKATLIREVLCYNPTEPGQQFKVIPTSVAGGEMTEPGSNRSFTQLLVEWGNGDDSARDEILPQVYGELRRLAAFHLKRERKNHTLQATALVHEAYLRLVNQRQVDWRNRAQFLGLASEIMRRILVNYARDRSALKRGGDVQKVSLSVLDRFSKQEDLDVLALDEALLKLADRDERKSRVVELKFFGGLTNDEIGEVLEVSHATVERDWTLARAWLYRELSGGKSLLD